MNSDLPSSPSVDMSDTEAYLQAVDSVLRSGVPNYKGVRIPLSSSFNWDFLKANTIDYHDKALIDYIIYGLSLGLNPNHTITSNAVDNHPSARDFPRFRNVRIDPADAIHLGIKWNNQYFVDRNLAFGAVHGTDLIRFLMAKHGFKVHNCIDDIYAVCHKDSAHEAFETLKEILHNIGLPLNHKKVFSPCATLDIMGIVVNIESCTFSITEEKITEISKNCIELFLRDRFTRRELQSLLGKLLYVSRCVAGSCRFLNRMLHTLRLNHANREIFPDNDFRLDLLWFLKFLRVFNGVVSFRCHPVQHHVYVDATLTGLGGVWGNRIYLTHSGIFIPLLNMKC